MPADLNALRDQLVGLLASPGSPEAAYKIAADFAQKHGLSAENLNQMVQSYGGSVAGQFDTARIQNILDQYGAPQYGLAGATNAIAGGTSSAINSVAGGAQNAISAVTGGTRDAANTINQGLQTAIPTLQGGINTAGSTINQGLQSAVTSLQGGQTQALSRLGQTQGQVSGLFNAAQQNFQPYMGTGTKANDLQAALSGALGPEAQKQAFANYQESPGVDYARSQAEKAITRNASALGGLGGGNVMSELMRNAVGTYLQDFGNQFNRVGSVADRGLSAAGASANLSAQEAGIQSGLGQFGAQIPLQTASQIAGLQTDAANNIGGMQFSGANTIGGLQAGAANTIGNMQFNTGNNVGNIHQTASNNIGGMQFGTGNTIGSFRYQAGQDLANSVNSTTSSLSNLINQQGAAMTDIIGNTTNSLNQLYQAASAGDANAMEQLASLLGNISTQSANMYSSQPIIQGQQSNYLGQLGQIAGGVGGLAQGLSYGQQPATQSVYTPAANNPSANYYTNYGGYA